MTEFTGEIHPAASLFPMMADDELEALAADIKANGLLEPVVLCDGMVLDGRNRLRACEIAGVEPAFTSWEANGKVPVEFVVSMNLHRRHLTVGQRAALALELLPHLEDEAKERRGERTDLQPRDDSETKFGRSVEKAAALVGVGRTTVATAKQIQQKDHSGQVVEQMRAGELNVNEAVRRVGRVRNPDVLGGNTVYYGKGDKFKEAIVPAVRYARAWKTKKYPHLNYKEARRRLRTIDELIAALTDIRAELEFRSRRMALTKTERR